MRAQQCANEDTPYYTIVGAKLENNMGISRVYFPASSLVNEKTESSAGVFKTWTPPLMLVIEKEAGTCPSLFCVIKVALL